MWKLRTMRVAGPGGAAGGAPIASVDDERVTPFGRRLRHWRLDELPQLLNVVRGEMALVGPRPETPEYVDLADGRWQRVLAARPGIVGPTQLAVYEIEAAISSSDGDGDEDVYRDVVLPAKLAIDAWYVEQASPFIDFVVVVSFVQRFVLGRKALLLDAIVARDVVDLGPVRASIQQRSGRVSVRRTKARGEQRSRRQRLDRPADQQHAEDQEEQRHHRGVVL